VGQKKEKLQIAEKRKKGGKSVGRVLTTSGIEPRKTQLVIQRTKHHERGEDRQESKGKEKNSTG